jgi:hypothetical protein
MLLQVPPAQRELQLPLLPAVLPAAVPFSPSFWVAAVVCLLGQGMLQSQGETSDPRPCLVAPALLTLLLRRPLCPRLALQTACVAATAQSLGSLQSPAGFVQVLLGVACLQAEQAACRARMHGVSSSSVSPDLRGPHDCVRCSQVAPTCGDRHVFERHDVL